MLNACDGSPGEDVDVEASADTAGRMETGVGDTAHVAQLECEGLERSLLAATPTRAAFREAFGAADSVIATTEPNRHEPGRTDSLFTVHYPGFVASFRKPGGGGDMVTGIELRDNRYVSAPRIGIGASASAVVAALGQPTRGGQATAGGDAVLIYDCGPHVEQPVTFHLTDGRVTSIVISYYVD